MRLARVLGAIGRGLISAGVIVLLFVAYQLWGTGLQNAASQTALAGDLAESTGVEVDASDQDALAALARESQDRIEDGDVLPNDAETDAADTTGNDTDNARGAGLVDGNFVDINSEIVAKLYPAEGEAFARVIIPAINVDQISVEGVSVEDLRKGPGHYRTTPNPGQAGNAAIAGHRTTYGAPFHRVDELSPDDSIFVITAQGTFEYRVTGFDDQRNEGGNIGYFIVDPSETWVLDDKPGRNTLTLTACHPKYSARQRIIVQAELVGEPVPTIPRSEADDLGSVTLAAEDVTEQASAAEGVDGDAEITNDGQQVMSDEVAADDDPTVDAEGNPIGDTSPETATDTQTDDTTDAETGTTNDTTEADESISATDTDAELASDQTPFSSGEQDFGEGLNGDPTKVKPAMLWGVSGLFIWIAAWFTGSRLDRKWTLYLVALAPFGLVLWSTFVNVDQALPSY